MSVSSKWTWKAPVRPVVSQVIDHGAAVAFATSRPLSWSHSTICAMSLDTSVAVKVTTPPMKDSNGGDRAACGPSVSTRARLVASPRFPAASNARMVTSASVPCRLAGTDR
ncbi:hypothetical protein [Actinoplanes sp. NPDC026623]|uniref:hypothetical protein n=1 Tax=Actinoplanes sp. NPDC026623 TaxID=3155610 RepID=UPI0033ECF123